MTFFGALAGTTISGWYAARLANDERKIQRREKELEKWKKKEGAIQDFIWIVTRLEMKTEKYKEFFENTHEKVNYIYPLTFSDEYNRLEQNRILFLGNHKMEIAIDELKQRVKMAEIMTGKFIDQFLKHHTRPDSESLFKYVASSQKAKRESLPVFNEELSKIEATIRQMQSEINRTLSEQPQTLWDVAKMRLPTKKRIPMANHMNIRTRRRLPAVSPSIRLYFSLGNITSCARNPSLPLVFYNVDKLSWSTLHQIFDALRFRPLSLRHRGFSDPLTNQKIFSKDLPIR